MAELLVAQVEVRAHLELDGYGVALDGDLGHGLSRKGSSYFAPLAVNARVNNVFCSSL